MTHTDAAQLVNVLAAPPACRDNLTMRGLGERLKARARELGLSNFEVARRLGIGQGRYSSWVNDTHEPDLETLARVVGVLMISGDQTGPDGTLRSRADVALRGMLGTALAGAVGMLKALARAAGGVPEPGQALPRK